MSVVAIQMGDRIKDRKPEVRKMAVVGLARIYHRHVSSTLPPLDYFYASAAAKGHRNSQDSEQSSDDERMQVAAPGLGHAANDSSESSSPSYDMFSSVLRKDLLDKLALVPHLVVGAFGYPELRQQVIVLIQENLLPKTVASRVSDEDDSERQMSQEASQKSKGGRASSSQGGKDKDKNKEDLDGPRATALILLYTLLQTGDHAKLGTILGEKSKVRADLQAFLEARQVATASGAKSSDFVNLKSAQLRLVQTLPTSDKKTTVLEKLHAMKDKTIFRLLGRAVIPKDPVGVACGYREDLKQRLDSKSALGDYAGVLFDYAGYLVANQGMIAALLGFAAAPLTSTSSPGFGRSQRVAAEMLHLLAKHVPKAYGGAAPHLAAWLQHCSDLTISAQSVLQAARQKV